MRLVTDDRPVERSAGLPREVADAERRLLRVRARPPPAEVDAPRAPGARCPRCGRGRPGAAGWRGCRCSSPRRMRAGGRRSRGSRRSGVPTAPAVAPCHDGSRGAGGFSEAGWSGTISATGGTGAGSRIGETGDAIAACATAGPPPSIAASGISAATSASSVTHSQGRCGGAALRGPPEHGRRAGGAAVQGLAAVMAWPGHSGDGTPNRASLPAISVVGRAAPRSARGALPRGTTLGGVFPGLIARPLRASLILFAAGRRRRRASGSGTARARAPPPTRTPPCATSARPPAAAAGPRARGPARRRLPPPPERHRARRRRAGRPRPRPPRPRRSTSVTPAPGGYREELDISEEHVEASLLRVGQARATRRVSRAHRRSPSSASAATTAATCGPPPLRCPRRLAVGATWSVALLGRAACRSACAAACCAPTSSRWTAAACRCGWSDVGHRHRRHPSRAAHRHDVVVAARSPCRCAGASTATSAASPAAHPRRA